MPRITEAQLLAAIPSSIMCGRCGARFGAHALLACPSDSTYGPRVPHGVYFEPSIYVDARDETGNRMLIQRDPLELARLQRAVADYRGLGSTEVNCLGGETNGDREGGRIVCRVCRTAFTPFAAGAIMVPTHNVPGLTVTHEPPAPASTCDLCGEDDHTRDACTLCECGDGCDRNNCPACEELSESCTSCGDYGHTYQDCPVASDDFEYEDEPDDEPAEMYDDTFESTGCNCVDCVAASTYQPEVS